MLTKYITLEKVSLMLMTCMIAMSSCKSPTDLDSSIKEIPIASKPVQPSEVKISVDGAGLTDRFTANGQMDYGFRFISCVAEKVFIDTTSKESLKVALKFNVKTSVDDNSNYEEAVPYEFECEIDTMNIPVFTFMPDPQKKRMTIPAKANMKSYVFFKKKESMGFRIIRSERVFNLMDGDNTLGFFVYAVRTQSPGRPQSTVIFIESRFSVNNIQIESEGKKIRTAFYGNSITKLAF